MTMRHADDDHSKNLFKNRLSDPDPDDFQKLIATSLSNDTSPSIVSNKQSD